MNRTETLEQKPHGGYLEPHERFEERANPSPEGEKNLDPITGTPGSHPVGSGLGAAGGGAAGAAIGAAAGPVGAVIGAAVGGVVGGLIGKGVAESANPTIEHDYWRANFSDRPYVDPGALYDEYGPAYQYGWESYERYPNRPFHEVEDELARDWESRRGRSTLSWDRARHAVRDAWERLTGPAREDRRRDTGY